VRRSGSPADILIEPPRVAAIIRFDGAKAFITNEIADQTRVSIFIVDDHPVVRDGLKSLLEREPDLLVCGEAAGAATALEQITRALPDIVLLDISLSQGSGLELLKDVTIHHPKMPVVVLSMHDEMVYAERAIRAGARGYVMKGESSAQVVLAIRRVLAGKVFLGDRVMSAIANRLGQGEVTGGPIERLSDRELQVFEMIGKGRSTSEIAHRLHISAKTVQVYVARAKEKFGVSTLRELMREAICRCES
jgi:DNA-binding NarL/FixJ family response regulator